MSSIFRVPFLTVESGDDLIVSFPLDLHARTSLTLFLTPKYESLLDDGERGVSFGTGNDSEGARELLVLVRWGKDIVEVASTIRNFTLDLSAVDPCEIKEAKTVLKKMNFDKRFEFADV